MKVGHMPSIDDGLEARKVIVEVCDAIKEMLLTKNISYGSSFSHPMRVFSNAPTDEQINVRIDDKLSRIKNKGGFAGDNDLEDLAGYILLKMVNQKMEERGLK
jgi:hypothetical protein